METPRNKDFDHLVAQSIAQLSLEERTVALQDLHGVNNNNDSSSFEEREEEGAGAGKGKESTEVQIRMNMKIESMDNALTSYQIYSPGRHETYYAYQKALAMDWKYVDSLKVMFIRAAKYDANKAALQLLRHFTTKLELFGTGLLVQDVTYQDLGVEERLALRRGLVQILPHRDRAGRAVGLLYGKVNTTDYSTPAVMRVVFYTAMSLLHDEETQIRGLVLIVYTNDQLKIVPGRAPHFAFTALSLPIRIDGFHYCADSFSEIQHAGYIALRLFERITLCRFRLHTGTFLLL